MAGNDPIDDLRDDALNPRELQETRYTNCKVLREMVDPLEIQRRHEQHDLLWWALGWLPMTAKNWKVLGIVIAIALLVGGRDFIGNLVSIAERSIQ